MAYSAQAGSLKDLLSFVKEPEAAFEEHFGVFFLAFRELFFSLDVFTIVVT